MRLALLSTVFIVFSFGGFYAAFRERQKIKVLTELERLLSYMENEIVNYRKELEDIFLSFESPFLDRIGFSRKLGEEGFSGAVRHLKLDGVSRNALLDFSDNLGILPSDEQRESIVRCRKILDGVISVMRSEYPQKRKLYISFGMMVGALIFIIGI